jgi:hypothetical protein
LPLCRAAAPVRSDSLSSTSRSFSQRGPFANASSWSRITFGPKIPPNFKNVPRRQHRAHHERAGQSARNSLHGPHDWLELLDAFQFWYQSAELR